jgi:ABC-type transport system involved in multi-copper enzyme maturation permease subunit
MNAVLRRLLRGDARRLLILSLSLVAWFVLILLVVRNSASAITMKSDMVGSSMMKGFGIGNLMTPDAMLAQMVGVSFNHPLVLALVGAVSVAPGIRACQGELLAGTLDLTLARPVARWRYLLAYTIHALTGVVVLMLVSWGSMVGLARLLDVPGTMEPGRAAMACLQAGIVFFAFYAIAAATSVAMSRKGNAMFVAIGMLTAMFALTFAERGWDSPVIGLLEHASVFHGFDPGMTLQGFSVETGDVIVPVVISIVALAFAFGAFERRDL